MFRCAPSSLAWFAVKLASLPYDRNMFKAAGYNEQRPNLSNYTGRFLRDILGAFLIVYVKRGLQMPEHTQEQRQRRISWLGRRLLKPKSTTTDTTGDQKRVSMAVRVDPDSEKKDIPTIENPSSVEHGGKRKKRVSGTPSETNSQEVEKNPEPNLLADFDENEELDHLNVIRRAHQRNLRLSEQQLAQLGPLHAPPYLIASIEDLKVAIAEIDDKINNIGAHGISHQKNPGNEPTKQVKVVFDIPYEVTDPELLAVAKRALAAILNISIDQVIIRELQHGSIVLTIELPDEAADRLQEMYARNDPALREILIYKVEPVADDSKQDASMEKSSEQLLNDLLNREPEK